VHRGVERLLNALVAMEQLAKVDDAYFNTPPARNFFAKIPPKYLGHIILQYHHLLESWSKLEQSVQSGKPLNERSFLDN